jgi:trk system potassium uptake protein TrkA
MNIMACSVANKVGAKKTIARIRNEDYGMMNDVVDLDALGVDRIIHPEKELSKELLNLVLHPNAIDVYELYNSKILIVSIIIKEDSHIIGKSLGEISKTHDLANMRAVIIEKGTEVIIPGGNYIVKPNDKVYAVVDKENVDMVFKVAGFKEETNKDLMINGCGHIAQTIAEALEKNGKFNVKIIVNDEEKANQFSELFANTLVVQGDATDVDILAAEGIIDMDFFLALTDDDEANMVSSLLANHLKVKRTITLIEKTDYFPITKTIGLQRCINSSVTTSNAIMRVMRHGNILASSTLKGIDVEVITFKVSEQNRYVDQPLHQMKLPKNSIIGVIVRNGKIFVPAGKNMIKPGDEIVVFSGKSSVNELEKMFA